MLKCIGYKTLRDHLRALHETITAHINSLDYAMYNIWVNYRRMVPSTPLSLLVPAAHLGSLLKLHAELQERLVQAVDFFLYTGYLE